MEQRLPSSDGKSSTGAYCRYRIEDRSYFAIIKKEVAKEAELLGFSAERIGKLQLVVAELVSNLLKFGERNREFLWKRVYLKGEVAIELLALDKGPGINSINQALEDGFSTSGTAGEGLGAIKRQSGYFELSSQPGQGTVVLSRIFKNEEFTEAATPFIFAAFSVAKPNEKLCGDGYYIEFDPKNNNFNILLIDGLGHGEGAYEAAQAAIEEYKTVNKDSPHEVLRKVHERIKKTRGGVAMVVKYDFEREVISFCGVGNIIGKTINYQSSKFFPSFNGIIGHVLSSRVYDQEVPWERGNLLLLHSDGLTSRWDLTRYHQVQKSDPAILAACLYRDYSRGNDDTTIIISKHPAVNGKGSKTNS